MEKAVRSQFVRWQLILGAVVCAIVAFCVLPGSVIAADVETKTVFDLQFYKVKSNLNLPLIV